MKILVETKTVDDKLMQRLANAGLTVVQVFPSEIPKGRANGHTVASTGGELVRDQKKQININATLNKWGMTREELASMRVPKGSNEFRLKMAIGKRTSPQPEALEAEAS